MQKVTGWRREVQVALSKHSQPIWFRVAKYIMLAALLWFFWEKPLLWMFLAIIFVLSLALHLWYRYKTKAWTRSYGRWQYHK